jgi:hypothetical protein
VLARQPGYWEPFGSEERPHVIEVDTSDPTAVAAAVQALAARAGS